MTLIIPPYLRKFNRDVSIRGETAEEENLDFIKEKKKTVDNEEESKIFEKDKKNLHEIEENHLMQVLDERFEINDKQMAEVMEEILRISTTRSMHIVRKFRTEKSRKSSKFFDPELFKYVKE